MIIRKIHQGDLWLAYYLLCLNSKIDLKHKASGIGDGSLEVAWHFWKISAIHLHKFKTAKNNVDIWIILAWNGYAIRFQRNVGCFTTLKTQLMALALHSITFMFFFFFRSEFIVSFSLVLLICCKFVDKSFNPIDCQGSSDQGCPKDETFIYPETINVFQKH